jgi:two-component system sensor histidine kinase EvgS
LQFDVVRGRSLDRQIEQLKAGELDVLPVVTPSSEREAELQFTRAYLNNPFVLISATTAGSPRSLDDLQGKRLAIYRGHPLRDYLVRRVPRFSGGGAQSRRGHGTDRQGPGRCDGQFTAGGALSACPPVPRAFAHHQHRWRSTGTHRIGDRTAGHGAAHLNKALLSIAPQQMDELVERWSHDVVVEESWVRHRREIVLGFAAAAGLLVLAGLDRFSAPAVTSASAMVASVAASQGGG